MMGTSTEAVFFEREDWGHRAGMTADLTPAEAPGKKDAGFGPGLEADELGHESFGTVQFVLDCAEAEVWAAWERVLAAIYSHFEVSRKT